MSLVLIFTKTVINYLLKWTFGSPLKQRWIKQILFLIFDLGLLYPVLRRDFNSQFSFFHKTIGQLSLSTRVYHSISAINAISCEVGQVWCNFVRHLLYFNWSAFSTQYVLPWPCSGAIAVLSAPSFRQCVSPVTLWPIIKRSWPWPGAWAMFDLIEIAPGWDGSGSEMPLEMFVFIWSFWLTSVSIVTEAILYLGC